MSSPKILPPDAERLNQPSAIASPGLIFWLCVSLAFALAAGIRLFVLTEPLWLDELHTAWVVDTDLDHVAERAAAGNQAPLFFWLTWIVTKAIGTSAVSLRLLSLLSSLLLIALAAYSVFRWTGSAAALLSVVLLFAFDPLMVFYATEARPYALLQLVGLIQIAVFWRLWQTVSQNDAAQRARREVVLLSVCSAVLVYVHYTSGLLFAAEAVFVLSALFVRGRQASPMPGRISMYLAWLVLTALLCAPTIGNLRIIFERKEQWVGISSAAELLGEWLPTRIVLVGLPIAISGLLWISGKSAGRDMKAKRLQLPGLFFSCALVPVFISCITDQVGFLPLAHSRYVVVSFMAIIVFVGIIIGDINSKSGQWLLATIVLASNALLNPMTQSLLKTGGLLPFRQENWESPIEQVNELDGKSSSPVFLIAGLLEDRDAATNQESRYQEYLKFPVSGIYKVDNPERVIPLNSAATSPFSKSQIALMKGEGSALILIRATRQHVELVLSSLQKELGRNWELEYFASPDSDVILVRLRMSH